MGSSDSNSPSVQMAREDWAAFKATLHPLPPPCCVNSFRPVSKNSSSSSSPSLPPPLQTDLPFELPITFLLSLFYRHGETCCLDRCSVHLPDSLPENKQTVTFQDNPALPCCLATEAACYLKVQATLFPASYCLWINIQPFLPLESKTSSHLAFLLFLCEFFHSPITGQTLTPWS